MWRQIITARASAVAAFSAVVSCLFIVIMAYTQRNTDLSLEICRLLWTGCRFTARISNLFLVLHKCNVWIYFLLLLTQVDFFVTTFYFLESRKFSHYFYFLKSRIFGMYFYFLESSKVIYFWQHCPCLWTPMMIIITLMECNSVLIMFPELCVFCTQSVYLCDEAWNDWQPMYGCLQLLLQSQSPDDIYHCHTLTGQYLSMSHSHRATFINVTLSQAWNDWQLMYGCLQLLLQSQSPDDIYHCHTLIGQYLSMSHSHRATFITVTQVNISDI